MCITCVYLRCGTRKQDRRHFFIYNASIFACTSEYKYTLPIHGDMVNGLSQSPTL